MGVIRNSRKTNSPAKKFDMAYCHCNPVQWYHGFLCPLQRGRVICPVVPHLDSREPFFGDSSTSHFSTIMSKCFACIPLSFLCLYPLVAPCCLKNSFISPDSHNLTFSSIFISQIWVHQWHVPLSLPLSIFTKDETFQIFASPPNGHYFCCTTIGMVSGLLLHFEQQRWFQVNWSSI